MSFECSQTDGDRQYGPCPVRGVQPEVHSSMSTKWPGNSVRAVGIIMNNMRNPSDLYGGLHGPVWLYVVGMPPCDYLPIFATLNPQSTCHGPRAGPTLSPWCLGGLPACPGAESTRKDPRTEEKKMPMGKSKHISTW